MVQGSGIMSGPAVQGVYACVGMGWGSSLNIYTFDDINIVNLAFLLCFAILGIITQGARLTCNLTCIINYNKTGLNCGYLKQTDQVATICVYKEVIKNNP